MMSLSQMVRSMALHRQNQLATVYADRSRTWLQWLADIQRLAGGLQALGMAAGDRCAIVSLNTDRYLDAIFANAWAGGITVPINTRLEPGEVAYILDHAEVCFVFVDEACAPLLAAAIDQSEQSPTVIAMEPGTQFADVQSLIDSHAPIEDAGRCDDDVASILYTGGTTGRSKGVMLTHAGHVIHSMAMWSGRVTDFPNMRFLHTAPMFHAADIEFAYGVTAIGGTHYIVPRFEPGEFIESVARWRITDSLLVPTMIQMTLAHEAMATTDLTCLKRLWYGGAPIAEAVLRKFKAALPTCGPVQLYGQTEACPIITCLEVEDHDLDGPHPERLRSCGRAIQGCEVRIAGPDGAELPTGEVGEILARSGTIMAGYWRDPEQTASTIRDGWLHTGDAGYMDEEGYVFITDRIKDMIISGGENVYSTEVEQAIYAIDGVAQCAVIGLPDEKWGERVHAVIVPGAGKALDADTVRNALKGQLAGFKIPRSMEFREGPLPTSGAGKILKRVLRDQAREVAGDAVQG